MKFQIKKIVKKISNKIDIVWSFDLGNYYPFKFFDANAYKIFHPVDEPLTKEAIQSAVGADIIFSVTNEILDKYKAFNIPSYFIHHGLAQEFLQNKKIKKIDTITRVGLSGNWLRPDVDHNTVLKIIIENPNVIFNFWGSYEAKQSNIGGSTNDVIDKFLLKLKTCTNVRLHWCKFLV